MSEIDGNLTSAEPLLENVAATHRFAHLCRCRRRCLAVCLGCSAVALCTIALSSWVLSLVVCRSMALPACADRPVTSDVLGNGTIPFNLFVTARSLSGPTKAVWDENAASFPDFFNLVSFQFFDDDAMACSAATISLELSDAGVVEGAYEAFTSLRPAAYRADLWRCMILWSLGGLYLDAKMVLKKDPREWIDYQRDAAVFTKDLAVGGLYNAVMAARRRSPEIADAIRHIVNNVQSRSYGLRDSTFSPPFLAITGPGAVAEALGMKDVHGVPHCWHCSNYVKSAYGSATRIQSQFMGQSVVDLCSGATLLEVNIAAHKVTHSGYQELWWNDEVYCDQPGPACPVNCDTGI
uniref:Uncharacterized protein n=1 Tax=Noctiluca scintillans TaxID=2966 RepID=A0A7S1F1G9_NOCSC